MEDGRIARVTWTPFAIPFRAPLRTAAGDWARRDGFLVGMETADGMSSAGEGSTLPSVVAAAPGRLGMDIGRLGQSVIGLRPAEAWGRLQADRGGMAPALFAVESAVAALAATAAALPLYRWLAATASLPDPGGARAVPVNALVDAIDPAAAAAAARAAVDQGYDTVKLKVGTGVEPDIARIVAVREAMGAGYALRIDANGGWTEAEAGAVLEAAGRHGVALCEQPVAPGPGAPGAFTRLRRVGVPLAADESCRSPADLEGFLGQSALDAVVVKPMLTGLGPALAMIGTAVAAGLVPIVTTTFDAAPATMVAIHVAGTIPPPRAACGLATIDLLADPLGRGLPAVLEGAVTLPACAGAGLVVDDAALRRYATGPTQEVRG